MSSKTVTVASTIGLHARPAALIAEAAAEFDAEIWLTPVGAADPEPSDAASALMIMALGAGPGDRITVSSTDPAAVEKIAALIERDLDA